MNLSRAAKKFRAQMPQEPEAPKQAKDKKKGKPPPPTTPEPVPAPAVETVAPVEPNPEPEVPAEAAGPDPVPDAQPKKVWPVKAKRPRFVREKAEKRERVTLPPLPPPSKKPAARLLTKNLALPPKDDTPKGTRV